MQLRDYGQSGFKVSALGLGAAELGAQDLDPAERARVLEGALDLGVTLIDTARGYGVSEEEIGRVLSRRRGDFVLSSKGGYSAEGAADWTSQAVRLGIEQALKRLRTDYIDIFHLHSCSLDVLQNSGVVEALDRARQEGWIRVAAYSGENAELEWALADPRFGGVQTSVNLVDQRSLELLRRSERSVGVIAKRALANAAWRFSERPTGSYAEVYWERLQESGLQPGPLGWVDTALRFAAFAPKVTSVILGTRSLEHLREAAAVLERGPLEGAQVQAITEAFWPHREDWPGKI